MVFERPQTIEILFQNQHYLVANKPTHLVCAPTLDAQRPNLQTLVQECLSGGEGEKKRIVLPHRLDKETSGVVMFLLSEQSYGLGEFLFKKRETTKIYWTVVEGEMAENQAEVELVHFLKKLKVKGHLISQVVHAGGDKAVLHYRVLKSLSKQMSLMEIRLSTGRMHQIRSQLAAIGHPLWGDKLYGSSANFEAAFLLHARSLSWKCPLSGEDYLVSAPLPSGWAHIPRFLQT